MRIDIAPPDSWGRLSEAYRAHLPANLQDLVLNVHIFSSVAHAIVESTKSFAQLYAHKKMIAIVSDVDPSFDAVAVAFSQDEFQVRMITPAQALQPETWSAIVDELLFVLAPEDDPITGKIIDLNALHEALKGKRLFKILVSHEAHNWKPLGRPEPFTVRILSLDSDRALLIGGERVKLQPLVSPALFWAYEESSSIAEELKTLREPKNETSIKAEVLNFESQLPAGYRAYFKSEEARVFDRALFYSEDLDGLAIIEELSATLGVNLTAPGERSSLETTSACRWESPRLQDWMIAKGESEATTRGLIIASSELISKNLAAELEKAAAKISRLQNGE